MDENRAHDSHPMSDHHHEADSMSHEQGEDPHAHHHDQSDPHHDHSSSDHHRMMIRDFRKRFYISLVLTLPILVLSPFIQEVLGFVLVVPGARYILLALSTAIFGYGGWPFLTGARNELSAKNPGMMVLIALAITVAYAYSVAVTVGLSGTPFFWELATLIDVMLAGHWIEMRSVLSASDALQKLATLMPSTAHRKDGEQVVDVPLAHIGKGDILVVKPGEKIPSDGVVLDGTSYVNEAMLTGESKPIQKTEGETVIGGSINGDGSLDIQVEAAGEESYLSKVIELVRQAEQSKSRTQAISDTAAFWLTLVAVIVGTGTLVAWLVVGRDLQFAITRMATVMVITCPHALGLAIPLVVSVSSAKSARNGLLIRNRTAFENARKITTVLFDKTGTLTHGTFEVNSVGVHDDRYNEQQVIRLAAALEARSEHPIAKGIVTRAKQLEASGPAATEFQAIKGVGVEGTVDDVRARVVSPAFLAKKGLEIPPVAKARAGVTRVFVLADDRVIGSVALSDTIRPESMKAIQALQKRGIKCWMLTGDNSETAEAVAGDLGMDGFFAEVLPEDKQAKVEELQDQGEYIAMTGDGVNDAPALAQAQVGIAVGSGTDVAAATADIVLVNSNPLDITALILFGKATYQKMVQNLIWATGYNVVAIPLAAGVLFSFGILLSPAVGAIFMSLSTIIVSINARLLRLKKEVLVEAIE